MIRKTLPPHVVPIADSPLPPQVIARTVAVAVPLRLPQSTVWIAMEESPMRSDLRSLLRTRAHELNGFVTKLDRFLTYLFLGPAGQGMLLRDVLETAIRYYHEHAEHGDQVDIAAFMAASISVAATGICVYRVTGSRADCQVVWSPQDEGGMQRFVADNQLESIQFEQVAPTNAHRAAAKDRVHALLCTWEEAVALQRAGFDYRRYDAF